MMKKSTFFNTNFTLHIWPYFLANADYSMHAKENIYSSLKKISSYFQKDPLDIVEEDALQFMRFLEAKARIQTEHHYSPSYVTTIYRHLRCFYKFLYQNKIYLNEIYGTSISNHPFAEVYCNFADREIVTAEDIPEIKDIDLLLSSCLSPTLSLAIKMSIKMGLSATELIHLTKGQFIEKNENVYLELIDHIKKGNTKKRLLHVPSDLVTEINKVVMSNDTSFEHIIINIGNNDICCYTPKEYTLRTIQRHLQQCCEQAEIPSITFSDLRNFFIFYAKQSGVSDSEIADFTNQEGRWIRRFEIIHTDHVYHAADYINFYFK